MFCESRRLTQRLAVGGLILMLAGCGGSESNSQASVGAGGPAPALVKGAALFRANCAICHGNGGKGDGSGAAGLAVKPRDLTSEPYRYVDVAGAGSELNAIIAYIKTGRVENGMPPFAHLPEADLDAISQYVLSIRPKPDAAAPGGG
ncbi:MAG: cytochrome c [Leptolyngbya sp. PLA3]|nr:MAG: cytochrome c [Cyanobacteria bacterium CYA]MCE7969384.1 cytochrome c [Leptolyngbya sp. PL-A3]